MRKVMLGTAMATALVLGGCAGTLPNITTQIEQTAATIEANIQAGTAAACQIVPTIGTIVTAALTITGQSDIASLSSAAVSAIEDDLCTSTQNPVAAARLKAAPTPGAGKPVLIGRSNAGVKVTAWRAQ